MSIYEELYDWQKEIVNKIKPKKAFGLFLDMGTGKTPISLALAEQNECTKLIIITLNSKALEKESVNGSWLNWISKSSINYKAYDKTATSFDSNQPEALILNYESLFKRGTDKKANKKGNKKAKVELRDNIESFVNSCKNHKVALIIDESHKVKNLQSLQTSAIIKLQKLLNLKSKELYTYLLTGTPFTTGYEDLYAQLKLLGYSNTKGGFLDNYCVRGNVPGLLGWQQPIVGYKNVDNLYKLVHQFAITIKSEEVLNLPEKIFINHVIFNNPSFDIFTKPKEKGTEIIKYGKTRGIEFDSSYNTNSKVNNPFYGNIDYPAMDYLAQTGGSFYLRARQLSIGFNGNAQKSIWYDKTRLKELKRFLQDNVENYLLFYNYTPELLELYEICEELGYNIDVYCGEIKSTYYYEKYEKMSPEEKLTNKKNIILSNYSSGSTGLNWQEYNHCILFSMPLYKDFEQGIKRLHRNGQKNNVFYHIFMGNNWLDKRMKRALETQQDYSKEMFEEDLNKEI